MSISQILIDRHKEFESKFDDALQRLNNGESMTSIALSYNFGRDNFFNYMRKCGKLPQKTWRIRYSEDILNQSKKRYNNGESLTSISKDLNLNRKILSKDLQTKFNIEIRQDGRKPFNENFFENIDTPEKAYWLGFFYADGYNGGSKNNHAIEFCLADADKDSVFNFAKALNSRHKISQKRVVLNGKIFLSWRITIKSKKMSSDLSKHGCIPNKTFYLSMPNINESLMSHFARGFIDGDGCVYWSHNKTYLSITSACKDFLVSFMDYIKEKTGLPYSISYVKNTNNNWVAIAAQKNGIKNLFNYLYNDSDDSIRLRRKYDKFYEYNCRLRQKDVEKSEITRAELNGKAKCDDNAYANPSPKANIVNLWDIINIHIPFNF